MSDDNYPFADDFDYEGFRSAKTRPLKMLAVLRDDLRIATSYLLEVQVACLLPVKLVKVEIGRGAPDQIVVSHRSYAVCRDVALAAVAQRRLTLRGLQPAKKPRRKKS